MRRATRASLAALLLTGSLAVPAAVASPPAAPALAASVEAAARSGRLADAIAAAAHAGGPVTAMTYEPASLPASVPAALGPALADLLGAVRAADAVAKASLRATPAEIEAAAADATALMHEALTDPAPDIVARARAFRARSGALVDAPALRGAALALGEAIDRAIPALRAAAPLVPPEGAGCDLAEQAGVLCVAGTGATTITGEYALVVDLGGDDTHRHSAGGASPTVNGLAAAVTIDLGGHDTYDTRIGDDTLSLAVQGAGRVGGIGMLVDAAGDDEYAITSTKPAHVQLLGHGASVAGVGVFADREGDDSYAITSTYASAATHAQGQGFSVLGVLGLFLDTGQGDDVIANAATPAWSVDGEGDPLASGARAECCASAAGATVSVYVDDGGRDATSVAATSNLDAPGTTDAAIVSSHGLAGLGGVAVSITGTGDTERHAVATSQGPTAGQSTVALGAETALGGLSISMDAGGDDLYRGIARSEAADALTITDGCACDRPVRASSGPTYAGGLGYAVLGGAATQLDRSGDDRYELAAESVADAAVVDERVHPPGSLVTLDAGAESGLARPGGLGFGGGGAEGSFTDDAGADVYVVRGRSTASSSGAPDEPGYVHRSEATSGLAQGEALGAGFGDFGGAAPAAGRFQDLGGADAYVVDLRSSAVALPSGGAFEDQGVASVLGSVEQNAVATFLDEGGVDTISITPADPACEGERGVGTWADCGSLIGRGQNR